MVNNYSDRERENPLTPHRLLFPISSKGSFKWSYHRQDSTWHGLCYTSRGALAGTRNSDDQFDDPLLLPRSYISLQREHIYPQESEWMNEWMNEMFYLTTHSTHFIYGYMASDIWLRTILIVRKETRCRHMGYSFRLTARVLLYVSASLNKTFPTFWFPLIYF